MANFYVYDQLGVFVGVVDARPDHGYWTDSAPPSPAHRHNGTDWVLPAAAVIEQPLVAASVNASSDERQRLIGLINAQCDLRIAQLTAGYAAGEVLSWHKQESEARAAHADPAAATPFIDALASGTGRTRDELIVRILANAEHYAAVSGAIVGHRQRLVRRVRCGGIDELACIPIDAGWPEVSV